MERRFNSNFGMTARFREAMVRASLKLGLDPETGQRVEPALPPTLATQPMGSEAPEAAEGDAASPEGDQSFSEENITLASLLPRAAAANKIEALRSGLYFNSPWQQ